MKDLRLSELNDLELKSTYVQYKGLFEDLSETRIPDELFKPLFLNSQNYPYFNSKPSHYNLKDFHFRTKFKFPEAVTWLYQTKKITTHSHSGDSIDIDCNEFTTKGWAVVENYFADDFIEAVKLELNYQKYHITTKRKNSYTRSDIQTKKISELGASAFSSNLTNDLISSDGELSKVLNDTKLVRTISKLLGGEPYLIGATSLYTKSTNQQDESWKTNAQSWHLDYSHPKFLKVFIFLDDVPTTEYGPHYFVEGSHGSRLHYPDTKDAFWDYTELPSGYIEGHIKDEWVQDNYGKNSVKYFCGKKGDILIEDTSGLHKAGFCSTGHRDILQLLFSVSNFGHIYPERQLQINTGNLDHHNFYLSPLSRERRDFNTFKPKKSYPRKLKDKIFKIGRKIFA